MDRDLYHTKLVHRLIKFVRRISRADSEFESFLSETENFKKRSDDHNIDILNGIREEISDCVLDLTLHLDNLIKEDNE